MKRTARARLRTASVSVISKHNRAGATPCCSIRLEHVVGQAVVLEASPPTG